MRYWLDTEFIERGPEYPIRLLSIGIVAEDGREFYAETVHAHALISIDYDNFGDPWLRNNVQPHLRGGTAEMRRGALAAKVRAFCGPSRYGEPEFWAYYADYDWVVLCQLFGRMIDLPKGWPMFCRDVKQYADSLGNPQLPKQESGEHDALADARHCRMMWEFLEALKGGGAK